MIESLTSKGTELTSSKSEFGKGFNPDSPAEISTKGSDVHAPFPRENKEPEFDPRFNPDERISIGDKIPMDGEGDKWERHEPVEYRGPIEGSGLPHPPPIMNETSLPNNAFSEVNANPDSRAEVSRRAERTPVEGNGGHWDGERGNSNWIPNDDEVPTNPKTNPDGKTWREIKDEYGVESIPFNENKPDFSEVSKGTVEIEDFTDDRDSNFDQADEALAEQKGCEPEDVYKWRKEHKYTWHEGSDCKTMQKVPTEVHGNVPHSGGVSEYKTRSQGAE